MPNILEMVKDYELALQKRVQEKILAGKILTDEECSAYTLTDDDSKIMQVFNRIADGETIPGFTLTDFLSSPQAKILIPRVIIGAMRKASDPVYLASAFYKKIKMKVGAAVMFPSIGVMRAYDIAEAQEIPQETIDWQTHKGSMIHIGKSGLRVQFTDELIKDCEWDIVGMMLQEAGRAMARHKEQKAFTEWMTHGWTVFDNDLFRSNPIKYKDAGTNGVDYTNNPNGTMSIDDFLDLLIAVYNNEYSPTDIIMHPLVWTVFAKNGLTGSMTAPYDSNAKLEMPNGSFKLGPDSVQGRVPFAFNINLSPFAPIDKLNKSFDIFAVDKNNVGVQIVKDEMTTSEFVDPARDITNIKVIERYGFGTYNEGRAICSAKNISMAKSWPLPARTIVIDGDSTKPL